MLAPATAGDRALIVSTGPGEGLPSATPKDDRVNDVLGLLRDHWRLEAEEIAILRDQLATKRNILRTIKTWLINSTGPGDRVILYYNGFDRQLTDTDHDEADGLDEALVVHSATTAVAEAGYITDDELEVLLSDVRDRRVLVIIDSCRGEASAGTDLHGLGAFATGTNNLAIWVSPGAGHICDLGTKSSNFTRTYAECVTADSVGARKNRDVLACIAPQISPRCGATDQCEVSHPTQIFSGDLEQDSSLAPRASAPLARIDSYILEALGHDNRANVSIKLQPSTRLRLGDQIRISISASEPGSLIVLDIDPDGTLTQLYPSNLAETLVDHFDGQVELPGANSSFRLTAQEPLGKATLVAILTRATVSLSAITKPHRRGRQIGEPHSYVDAIAHATRVGRLREDDQSASSVTYLQYELVR